MRVLAKWGINEEVQGYRECDFFCPPPIYTSCNLAVGEELVARWKPDRRCVFKQLKDNLFEVIASENCKLCVGDTFCCDYFIEGEVMQVCNLTPKVSAVCRTWQAKKAV